MVHYFADTMTTDKAEPHHKLCQKFGLVSLQQRGKDNFAVRYGREVHARLTYKMACEKLGQALMHQIACDGSLDNRMTNER